MSDILKRIESILFSIGKKIATEEIARLCKEKDIEKVKQVLKELQDKYKNENSSLMIIQEGNDWKLTVKEAFFPYIKNIITETDLTKSVMETLAVIAHKAPVLQSEVIKIRTNKAYDHITELEKSGYITRAKHGRTKHIKLSQKFFDYFDILPDQLKTKFKNVAELEKVVEQKEKEVHEAKQEFEEKKLMAKQQEEKYKQDQEKRMAKLDEDIAKIPEIDLVDAEGHKHQLKTYDTVQVVAEKPILPPLEVVTEHLGPLDVYKEKEAPKKPIKKAKEGPREVPEAPPEEEKPEVPEEKPPVHMLPTEKTAEKSVEGIPMERKIEEVEEAGYDITKELPKEIKGPKLFEKGIPPEIQKRIDKRVKELLTGKEEKETKKEEEK